MIGIPHCNLAPVCRQIPAGSRPPTVVNTNRSKTNPAPANQDCDLPRTRIGHGGPTLRRRLAITRRCSPAIPSMSRPISPIGPTGTISGPTLGRRSKIGWRNPRERSGGGRTAALASHCALPRNPSRDRGGLRHRGLCADRRSMVWSACSRSNYYRECCTWCRVRSAGTEGTGLVKNSRWVTTWQRAGQCPTH